MDTTQHSKGKTLARLPHNKNNTTPNDTKPPKNTLQNPHEHNMETNKRRRTRRTPHTQKNKITQLKNKPE